jgi:multidrug efflux pump subunit AcrB
MQKLAEICIRRPVFAAMIVLSLVVVGAASYFKLGVDRFPSVDLPTVSVRTGLPGAAPEEVESLVTQPVEDVVNTVDGIDELRSISSQGTSVVIATFKLNRDLESAAQDIRDRVTGLGRRLPDDATPPVVQKFDNDSTPVLTIALSANRSLRELTELGDKIARPQLERPRHWRSRPGHQRLGRRGSVGGISNSDHTSAAGFAATERRRAWRKC